MADENDAAAMKEITGLIGGLEEKFVSLIDEQKKEVGEVKEAVKELTEHTTVPSFSVAGLEEKDAKRFSYAHVVSFLATGKWPEQAGVEKEIFDSPEYKAVSSTDDTAGGYLVPEEVIEFRTLDRAKPIVEQMGATVLQARKGDPISTAGLSTDVTGYWVGEGSAVTESTPAFDKKYLRPKKCGAYTEISREMMTRSSPAIDGIVGGSMGPVLANLQDLAYFLGTGSSHQPKGLSNQSPNTKSFNKVPKAADLWDMIYEIDLDNATGTKGAWAGHPKVWNLFRSMTDGVGRPLLYQNEREGAMGDRVLGFPFYKTTQLGIANGGATDEADLFFGYWERFWIAKWGRVIKVTSEGSTLVKKDMLGMLIVEEVDCLAAFPNSFCYCVDLRFT